MKSFSPDAKEEGKLLERVFPTLESSEVEELKRICLRVRYDEGELIAQEGSYAAGIYVVESGLICIGKYASKGWQKRSLRFLASGEMYGLEPVFLGREPINAQFAKAIVRSTLLFCERSNIVAFSKGHPHIFVDVCRWLSREVLMLEFKLARDALESVDQNLALLLVALANNYGIKQASAVVLNLPVPRQTLAELLGVSTGTLSRALRQFRERGLITTSQTQIIIRDLGGLRKRADVNPFYLSIIEETL